MAWPLYSAISERTCRERLKTALKGGNGTFDPEPCLLCERNPRHAYFRALKFKRVAAARKEQEEYSGKHWSPPSGLPTDICPRCRKAKKHVSRSGKIDGYCKDCRREFYTGSRRARKLTDQEGRE